MPPLLDSSPKIETFKQTQQGNEMNLFEFNRTGGLLDHGGGFVKPYSDRIGGKKKLSPEINDRIETTLGWID